MFWEKIKKLNPSTETYKIAYKLLNDLLLILLLFFVLVLIAEGALPGIISDKIGLYKIALPILLDILLIAAIAKTSGLKIANPGHKKTTWFLAVILALLVFNSLIKIKLWLAAVIFIFIAAAGYFIYKNLQE